MKINAENGWFKGVGDIVCYAWIGQGIREAGGDVTFYCNGWRQELFGLFGMNTTTDPAGAVVTHEGYEQAVEHRSPLNYLEWIHAKLMEAARLRAAGERGEDPRPEGGPSPLELELPPPRRPKLDMIPMERETGRRASANVLIFPHCVWPPRTWPKSYFIELAYELLKRGLTVKMVTESRDYELMTFHGIYQKSWQFIAAAIQWADLVIGNDSGPAHLAGTIGTRALAIHGPTQERIYGYLPEVTSFRKKSLPCAGCHCLPPFPKAGACEIGCGELYRTYPEDVLAVALGLLNMETARPRAVGNGAGAPRLQLEGSKAA